MRPHLAVALVTMLAACTTSTPDPPEVESRPESIRIASYNIALNDDAPGGVIARLEAGDEAARKVAAVIQRVRPDILLINELDYDEALKAAEIFERDYLEVGQFGNEPIRYGYRFATQVNTGEPSGLDLDGDGTSDGPNDAWGFGRHPGQYGMLLLSRYPIDAKRARTFRMLPWSAMPGALRPMNPDGTPFHPDAIWNVLRLSSKSHWDVPVATPFGELHVLASHPTPPAFDGPEGRNRARNHDEIRLFADYIAGGERAAWIVDDAGQRGGIAEGARFVIVGDQNADPLDGSSLGAGIRQLLEHPRVHPDPMPRGSGGGAEASARIGEANLVHRGDPDLDTSNFSPQVGNLRVDYALPSRNVEVVGSGVFWPRADEPGHDWAAASDHRLVWVDIRW
jgi:endonuclease/exonuclease/phosphatase family metal-dependent hydrolase